MRRTLAGAVAVAVAAAINGCSVVGAGSYRLTAYFPKTPSLYEKSRVKIMGADVGSIEGIHVENGRVRVDLTVDRDVPVPKDVRAAIVPANTLGERNIVLYPAWRQGQPKAGDRTVIPQDRTELPVEIDEALTAFTAFAEAIDPTKIGTVMQRGAAALNGHGKDINAAIQSTATLTHNLAAQDQKLISLATGLRRIAAGINHRDSQLSSTLSAFASTGQLLSDEREQLTNFLAGLEVAIRKGDVLVKAFQETLPSTLVDASEIVMTLKANGAAISELLSALPKLTDTLTNAWDRKNHVLTIRLALNASLRVWLQPIFDALGWGDVPCLPAKNLENCTKGKTVKR